MSVDCSDYFINAITEHEASIFNRNARLGAGKKAAVHIHNVFRIHLRHDRRVSVSWDGQPVLIAEAVYWQASLPNTWVNPALGSVIVAVVTVPLDVIVPDVSSIALPALAPNVRRSAPLLRPTVPLNGSTAPEIGFCQLLAVVRVPSVATSTNAGIPCPLARAPVQGKLLVRCNVNVQLPLACAGVIAPPPPMIIPSSGSVLVSHALIDIIVHTNRTARLT
jgi:hypothetical protein